MSTAKSMTSGIEQGQMEIRAARALLAAVRDADPATRPANVAALENLVFQINGGVRSIAPVLLKALADPIADVALASAHLLRRLCLEEKTAFDGRYSHLKQETHRLRSQLWQWIRSADAAENPNDEALVRWLRQQMGLTVVSPPQEIQPKPTPKLANPPDPAMAAAAVQAKSVAAPTDREGDLVRLERGLAQEAARKSLAQKHRPLGEILLEMKLIDEQQLQKALQIQQKHGGWLGAVVVQLHYVTEEQVTRALAKQFGVPFVNLAKWEIPTEVLALIPAGMVHLFRVIPIKRTPKGVIIAIRDPANLPFILDNLRTRTGMEVQWALASPQAVEMAIARYYEMPKESEEIKPTSAEEEAADWASMLADRSEGEKKPAPPAQGEAVTPPQVAGLLGTGEHIGSPLQVKIPAERTGEHIGSPLQEITETPAVEEKQPEAAPPEKRPSGTFLFGISLQEEATGEEEEEPSEEETGPAEEAQKPPEPPKSGPFINFSRRVSPPEQIAGAEDRQRQKLSEDSKLRTKKSPEEPPDAVAGLAQEAIERFPAADEVVDLLESLFPEEATTGAGPPPEEPTPPPSVARGAASPPEEMEKFKKKARPAPAPPAAGAGARQIDLLPTPMKAMEKPALFKERAKPEETIPADQMEMAGLPLASGPPAKKDLLQEREIPTVEVLPKARETERRRAAPFFEKALSEDAGRPGPVERLVAQSVWLMRTIQAILGLKFILLAHALDIAIDMVASYVRGIFRAWKMAKSVKRRLERHLRQGQVSALAEDLAQTRWELARLLSLPGFSLAQGYYALAAAKPWSAAGSPTFALKLVLETRGHLDEMKQDLALITTHQILKLVQKSFGDFLMSLVPNPAELFAGWKDLFILVFLMKYSRPEIEEMYVDLVVAYRRMIELLAEQESRSTASLPEKPALPGRELLLYEQSLIRRLGKGDDATRSASLDWWIEENRRCLQRLIQALCKPGYIIDPRKWSRFELVQTVAQMQESGILHPPHALELERWLTREVARALADKGFQVDLEEREHRWREAQDFRWRYRLGQNLAVQFM